MRAIWPGALLVVYLGVTAVVLLLGARRVEGSTLLWHIAGLLAVAGATWMRRTPGWVRVWLPLAALLALYAEMPTLIAAVGHDEMRDVTVRVWEARLFAGQPAESWAALWPSRALSEGLHLAYLAYYAIIFVVPAVLTVQRRHAECAEAVFALLLTFIVCFVCYLVFPVAGPRYDGSAPAPDGPVRDLVLLILQSGSSRGTAFPSSHVAVAVAQTLLATRYLGARTGMALGTITVGLGAGAVYGGFHYAVDVLAGVGTGLLVPMVAWALLARRRGSVQAKAMAPTYPVS